VSVDLVFFVAANSRIRRRELRRTFVKSSNLSVPSCIFLPKISDDVGRLCIYLTAWRHPGFPCPGLAKPDFGSTSYPLVPVSPSRGAGDNRFNTGKFYFITLLRQYDGAGEHGSF